ncbi:MAG: AI-2E family transporter [Actinomycetota bacterium]|nr:AI-2E family transporter [Actinomycetota bacterium]MDQ5807403.1 AI-2E family transporter [Actinomycetota bacterium]
MEPETPQVPSTVVVPRWVQLVTLPVLLLGLWALARAAGVVLLVFIVAAVTALILNPMVSIVQRARIPRGLAVAIVYVGFFLSLVTLGYFLSGPIADQVAAFQRDVPEFVDDANASLADLQEWLDEQGIDVEIQAQGQTALETLQNQVLEGSGEVVSFTGDLLREVIEVSIHLILVLVLSIYMLLYGPRIGRLVRSVMPPGDGTPEDDYPTRVQKAVSGYVRGQIMFSTIMGASAGLALWLYGTLGIFPQGKEYALAFGVFFGVMELVPFVGPVLGAMPPMLVALFDDPLTAVWVGLLFLALQQLEGHVVAPQVFSYTLRINPLLVIFALLFGAEIYGFVGALIALPIAAVLRETVMYLRRHLVLEPWGEGGLALAPMGSPPTRPPPCAECGAAPRAGDAYCRQCGSELRSSLPAA